MKQNFTKQMILRRSRKWLLAGATFLASFCFSTQAEAQTKEWDKTFGGTESEYYGVAVPTSDGGYIVGGQSNSGVGGDKTEPSRNVDAVFSDYWVVKVDAAGNKQWDRTLGGGENEEHTLVQQTADGGFLIAGRSSSDIGGDRTVPSRNPELGWDAWVVKLDAAGNKLWDKAYDASIGSILPTADGGHIMAGNFSSDIEGNLPSTGEAYWLVKVDANGRNEWISPVTTEKGITSVSVAVTTSDGGYVLGGGLSYTSPDSKGGTDYWVVKVNAEGNRQWERSLGGGYDDILKSVQQTLDGGYILGGESNSPVSGDKTEPARGGYDLDYWIVKLDAAGNTQWDRTFGSDYLDEGGYVVQTRDGGYMIAGSSMYGEGGDRTQPPSEEWDIWVVKTDASGHKLSDHAYKLQYSTSCQSIRATKDGGYLIGGYAGVMNPDGQSSSFDYYILKLKDDAVVAKPELASFTPAASLPGTLVTLTGKHLKATTSVLFNGAEAKFKVIDDCNLRVVVPALATTGKVEVKTATGSVLSKTDFTVLQPSIAKLTPAVGAAGSRFAIRGNHFSAAKQVLINGVAVTEFTVVDNTLIRAVVPQNATSGLVTVMLKGGAKAESSESFRVLTPVADKVTGTKELMAYPNPFVSGVTLPVTLDKAGPVGVLLYNTKGQQVKALSFTNLQAGEHKLEWDGKDSQNRPVTDGLYFYRLSVNGKLTSGQLLKSSKANR